MLVLTFQEDEFSSKHIKKAPADMNSRAHCVLAVTVTMLETLALGAALPEPSLYLPFDGTSHAALATGRHQPITGESADALLELHQSERLFVSGRVGKALDAEDTPLFYAAAGNLRPDEGTAALWLLPSYRGDDTTTYSAFFGAAKWGMVYKYTSHNYLTFGTARPDRDIYYDCNSSTIASWRPGEWHHIAVTWSRNAGRREIYLDGKLAGSAPFPHHAPVGNGNLHIGGGCALYPNPVAHAALDEVAVWTNALAPDTIAEIHRMGVSGVPISPALIQQDRGAGVRRLEPAQAITPTTPPRERTTPSREVLSLAGEWRFLPDTGNATDDSKNWGWSRVPGVCWDPGMTRGPDGETVEKTWQGHERELLSDVVYHQAVVVPIDWQGRRILLECDGTGGLSTLFVNGHQVGVLPNWEDASYDITDLVEPGTTARITISLRKLSRIRQFGIYGDVRLCAVPSSVMHRIHVTPRITDVSDDRTLQILSKPRLDIACEIWHPGPAEDAVLAFDIRLEGAASPALEFRHQVTLENRGKDRELYEAAQRVRCSFEWGSPVFWTYDSPACYVLRTRIIVAGIERDVSPPLRFGFREFTQTEKGFHLNGEPTHLRGHQIDLAWGSQMSRVEELKRAGMNSFEFFGPVSSSWYKDSRCFGPDFETILNYADTNGIIAAVSLPGATVLKNSLTDPEVARGYRRRLDKFIGRYGNHPSICLWHMHFNWAGYKWYHPPTKIDASYTPDTTRFLERQEWAMLAQEQLQSIDPRPVFHHACGNLGDVYSLNCYIGPTSPLQEREEWPSGWAATPGKPLVACEHGLLLIPYWFRPRTFPLSVVYAGEPIFDELTAKYLGDDAYAWVTPELYDLYDMERSKPRSARTRSLIRKHPGYQQVKSLFARRSLRSWRTYGVSGIIFNAINWDYYDDEGEALPVLNALHRYFGDTDMYIAGPSGNWPSKDHSFYSGERIDKQVILLNDLTRSIPATVKWSVAARDGRPIAQGEVPAVSKPGVPTCIPITFPAPTVSARTEFVISAQATENANAYFPTDTFSIEVFPREMAKLPSTRILLYDTHGTTAKVLTGQEVSYTRWTGKESLADADLLVIGSRSCDERFEQLSELTDLPAAIRSGLNVLVFEQTAGPVFGTPIREQSARHVFIRQPGHEFLRGLGMTDFVDLRGASNLIDAYPEAAPETEKTWPERYFKWGNRGVVSTFVLRKPHLGPFVPILECGFDLADSPLLEGRIGLGRVVLCQIDVTSRQDADPVSRTLVSNMLRELSTPSDTPRTPVLCMGEDAASVARQFALHTATSDTAPLLLVGNLADKPALRSDVMELVKQGATALLLPTVDEDTANLLDLQFKDRTLFRGEISDNAPDLPGIGNSDLFLKALLPFSTIANGHAWEPMVTPGLLALRHVGDGRVFACRIPIPSGTETRAQVKTTRFWNLLFCALGTERSPSPGLPGTPVTHYDTPHETIPPFINW